MTPQVVDALALRTRKLLVGFSCGKDALATLSICAGRFDRLEAFFFQYVEGLSFHQRTLRFAEQRWGVTIHLLPHWELAKFKKGGRLCTPSMANIPNFKINDAYDALRHRTGIEWIATGEKRCDSLERAGQMGPWPNGLNEKRRVAWPLRDWTNERVWQHLKRERIPIPGDYGICGHSFNPCHRADVLSLAAKAPEDFAKVCRVFPEMRAFPFQEKLRQRYVRK